MAWRFPFWLIFGLTEGRNDTSQYNVNRGSWWAPAHDVRAFSREPLPCCCPGAQHRRSPLCFAGQSVPDCEDRRGALRYVGPLNVPNAMETLHNHFSILRTTMAGDSLGLQLFETMVCYLRAHWTGWRTLPFPRHVVTYLSTVVGMVPTQSNGWLGWSVAHVGDAGRLEFYMTNKLRLKQYLDLIKFANKSSEAFILGTSPVHYNLGREHDYETDANALMSMCAASFGRSCIVLEPTPQHFQTVDGLFRPGARCEPTTADWTWLQSSIHGSWRKAVTIRLARKHGLVVLPMFDVLAPRGDAHDVYWQPRHLDCTHFTQDPEVWEPVILGFLQILPNYTNRSGRKSFGSVDAAPAALSTQISYHYRSGSAMVSAATSALSPFRSAFASMATVALSTLTNP